MALFTFLAVWCCSSYSPFTHWYRFRCPYPWFSFSIHPKKLQGSRFVGPVLGARFRAGTGPERVAPRGMHAAVGYATVLVQTLYPSLGSTHNNKSIHSLFGTTTFPDRSQPQGTWQRLPQAACTIKYTFTRDNPCDIGALHSLTKCVFDTRTAKGKPCHQWCRVVKCAVPRPPSLFCFPL